MDKPTFKEWYLALNAKQRESFCLRAGYAVFYVEKLLLYGKRTPRPAGLRTLARATRGAFTEGELLAWFLKIRK